MEKGTDDNLTNQNIGFEWRLQIIRLANLRIKINSKKSVFGSKFNSIIQIEKR